MKEIEAPECQMGYTQSQLERILGDRFQDFLLWTYGQTVGLCDGRQYNHETQDYEQTHCGPHGLAFYEWDLKRFLKGLPVID